MRTVYEENVRRLLDELVYRDEAGTAVPRYLTLSAGASKAFNEFAAAVEETLGPGKELESLADWGSKAIGTVARIAALLHVADLVDSDGDRLEAGRLRLPEVSEDAMKRAIRTFDFFARHARAAFDLAAHRGTPLTDADYVHATTRRKDWTRFTKQEIWQACRGRFDKTARLETALSVLVARGALIESVPERRGPGRPPAPTYRVVAASAVKPDIGAM